MLVLIFEGNAHNQSVNVQKALFEVTSAFSTVGLTMGYYSIKTIGCTPQTEGKTHCWTQHQQNIEQEVNPCPYILLHLIQKATL